VVSLQQDDNPEGGDMHSDASGINGAQMAEHGYEYDGARGLFEMEFQSYERYTLPLERGGQPELDFYSPCKKKAG
jgi:hypothetical protein